MASSRPADGSVRRLQYPPRVQPPRYAPSIFTVNARDAPHISSSMRALPKNKSASKKTLRHSPPACRTILLRNRRHRPGLSFSPPPRTLLTCRPHSVHRVYTSRTAGVPRLGEVRHGTPRRPRSRRPLARARSSRSELLPFDAHGPDTLDLRTSIRHQQRCRVTHKRSRAELAVPGSRGISDGTATAAHRAHRRHASRRRPVGTPPTDAGTRSISSHRAGLHSPQAFRSPVHLCETTRIPGCSIEFHHRLQASPPAASDERQGFTR